jgi:membrane protein implicated in regulation of membrane protease activity
MSDAEPESAVGKSAHVTVAIPGDDRPGEILIRIRGGSESFIAFCDQPVGVGEQVVVLADRGARTLLVAPL